MCADKVLGRNFNAQDRARWPWSLICASSRCFSFQPPNHQTKKYKNGVISMDNLENIPRSMRRIVSENIWKDEEIIIAIKGNYKEILICTDRRVLIIKSGIMTGHLFGFNIFQISYANISSVDVQFGIISGYFQVSAGGVQSNNKNVFSAIADNQPQRAPNCVSLNSKKQATEFREACSIITRRIDDLYHPKV